MKLMRELLPYVVIIIVVILIRTFLITPVRVSGISMYPTFTGNEVLLLNKVRTVHRLDIVVIEYNDERQIKRVIGMPGDTIEVRDREILINGLTLVDEFGVELYDSFDPITLGDNQYFVMGDNRDESKDSRYYGPIYRNEIEGVTTFVIFPFRNLGRVQ